MKFYENLSDPLDIEERDLSNQLMMSLTLTLVDEENIRQRLLEIRKQKLRKNFNVKQQGLKERFEKNAEQTLFENQPNILAKEDEEKALVQRYISKIFLLFSTITKLISAKQLTFGLDSLISDCLLKHLLKLNKKIYMSDYKKYSETEKSL